MKVKRNIVSMSMEQSTEQESNVGTGQERRAAPQRKDRRGLTLASVLGVMVLLTILRNYVSVNGVKSSWFRDGV